MTDKNKTGLNGQGSDQKEKLWQCPVCECVNIFSINSCGYCDHELQEPIELERRVIALEKEVADLKRQFEGQPFQPCDSLNENHTGTKQKCSY